MNQHDIDASTEKDCSTAQIALSEPPQALVVLEQLPVITARLKEIEAAIDVKTAQAKALVIDKASKQTAKDLRATLNKDSTYYEEIRKQIKTAILAPYDAFNAEYVRVIQSKYTAADAVLKSKISEIEATEISEKTEVLKLYFAEALTMYPQLDFVTFEGWNPKINLTVTLTALKKAAAEYLSRIAEDAALIDTQDHKEEIWMEYKQSLDCPRSIVMVKARHAAIEQEKAKAAAHLEAMHKEAQTIANVEAAAPDAITPPEATAAPEAIPTGSLAPPEVIPPPEDETQFALSFTVRATKTRLRALKQFLDDGGYFYE